MSLHYLLDGYNIIKQTPSLNRASLEDQRKALVHWININQPQGSRNNSVTIVFDGQAEYFGSAPIAGVKVIFSQGESADDLIKRVIENNKQKANWIVVSNDKAIKLYVRALGARVLSVKDFIGHGSTTRLETRKADLGGRHEAKKYIPLTQQAKITKELEERWLKPRK